MCWRTLYRVRVRVAVSSCGRAGRRDATRSPRQRADTANAHTRLTTEYSPAAAHASRAHTSILRSSACETACARRETLTLRREASRQPRRVLPMVLQGSCLPDDRPPRRPLRVLYTDRTGLTTHDSVRTRAPPPTPSGGESALPTPLSGLSGAMFRPCIVHAPRRGTGSTAHPTGLRAADTPVAGPRARRAHGGTRARYTRARHSGPALIRCQK